MIKNEKATITLEACMVLPVFLFILLFMYGIIMFFSGRQLISHAAFQAGQSLSLDSYAIETYGMEDHQIVESFVNDMYSSMVTDSKSSQYFHSDEKWYEGKISNEVENRFWGYFAGGNSSKTKKLLGLIGIKGGPSSIKFSSSSIYANNDLHVILEYNQRFVFDLGGRIEFPVKTEIVSHMWGLDEVTSAKKEASGGGGSDSSGGGQSGSR